MAHVSRGRLKYEFVHTFRRILPKGAPCLAVFETWVPRPLAAKGSQKSDVHASQTPRGERPSIHPCPVKWQGKQSADGNAEGTWKYVGGTGKFKTLKGTGTYKGKAEKDGSITFDVEGEYTLGK